jgi:hypothetical protein
VLPHDLKLGFKQIPGTLVIIEVSPQGQPVPALAGEEKE